MKTSYDIAYVGKNPLSLMAALIQTGRGKNVAVIDDSLVGGGSFQASFANELEKQFFIRTLSLSGVNLEDSDRFFSPAPLRVVVGNIHLSLGSSFHANFMELTRKILSPHEEKETLHMFNDPVAFNETMASYVLRLSNRFELSGRTDPAAFLKDAPPEFKVLLHHTSRMSKTRAGSLKEMALLSTVLSSFIVAGTWSDSSAPWLLLSLLSPRYRVETDLLVEHLQTLFLAKGGRILVGDTKEIIPSSFFSHHILLSSGEKVKTRFLVVAGDLSSSIPLWTYRKTPSIRSFIIGTIHDFSYPEDTLVMLPRDQGTKLAFAFVTRHNGFCNLCVAVRENHGEQIGHLLSYFQTEVSSMISTSVISKISFHQEIMGPFFHWEDGILSAGLSDHRLGYVNKSGFMRAVPRSAVWGSGAGHNLGLLSLLLSVRRK